MIAYNSYIIFSQIDKNSYDGPYNMVLSRSNSRCYAKGIGFDPL